MDKYPLQRLFLKHTLDTPQDKLTDERSKIQEADLGKIPDDENPDEMERYLLKVLEIIPDIICLGSEREQDDILTCIEQDKPNRSLYVKLMNELICS